MLAVCFQQVPFEGPGAFASALMKHGISLECHLVPKNGLPQDPRDLLSMKDGPMSVSDPRASET